VVDGILQGFETTLVVQMFGLPQNQPQEISDQGTDTSVENDSPEVQAEVQGESEQLTAVEVSPPEEVVEGPEVLATALIPIGDITPPPLFSPVTLSKAAALAVAFMVLITLVYDWILIRHRRTVRLVGKNLAHVIVILTVIYLVLIFRGGVIL